jgi:hypothetical protein
MLSNRPSPSKSTCHKSRLRSGFEALGFRLLLKIPIYFSDTPSSNSDLSLSEPQLSEKLSELVFLQALKSNTFMPASKTQMIERKQHTYI